MRRDSEGSLVLFHNHFRVSSGSLIHPCVRVRVLVRERRARASVSKIECGLDRTTEVVSKKSTRKGNGNVPAIQSLRDSHLP